MLSYPQPQDGMWNDIESQLSNMPAPSLSRRASTQRPSAPSTLQRGNSMRIVKPSQSASTHNSPLGLGLGSKAGLGRRMTVMGDTSGYRRRRLLEATAAIGQQQQQIIAQQSQQANGANGQQGQNQMRQRAGTTMAQRPMSWCPTMSVDANQSWGGNATQTATQQQGEAILRKQAAQYSPESQLRLQQLQQWQQMQNLQAQQQAMQQQQLQNQQAARIQQAQMQQLQAAQQAQAEQNYFAFTAQPCSTDATPYFSQQNTPLSFPTYSLPMNQYYDTTPNYVDNTSFAAPQHQDYTMYNTSNMNLAVPNMMAGTTPPTPETFPMQDAFQPQYVSQADKDWALDAAQDDGEVLVGLGLYSSPEKVAPKPVADVHLAELYARAGVALAGTEGKTSGKGLKLEETWEPPKDEEIEDDAEGEEEDEEDNKARMPPPVVPMAPVHNGGMAGWL